MNDNIFMERNLARDVGLFNPPAEPKPGKATEDEVMLEAVGFYDNGRSIYVPIEFAELLKDLPFARLVLGALITLWLQKNKPTRGDKDNIFVVVDTSLREIARTLGLCSNSGKNRTRIKKALRALQHVRYKRVVFFHRLEKKGRKEKVIGELCSYTILVPHLEFFRRGEKGNETVSAAICNPLSLSLLQDRPMARIPVKALKVLRKNPKAEKAGQNLLFFLAGSNPGKKGNYTLHLKVDTVIDAMRVRDVRRDKNVRRADRILEILHEAGFLAGWARDDKQYHVEFTRPAVTSKKKDRESKSKPKKRKDKAANDIVF